MKNFCSSHSHFSLLHWNSNEILSNFLFDFDQRKRKIESAPKRCVTVQKKALYQFVAFLTENLIFRLKFVRLARVINIKFDMCSRDTPIISCSLWFRFLLSDNNTAKWKSVVMIISYGHSHCPVKANKMKSLCSLPTNWNSIQ